MIVSFDTEFTAAIKKMATENDMSEAAVVKQAIRFYQLAHERVKAGETFSFSGDAERARDFAGSAGAR